MRICGLTRNAGLDYRKFVILAVTLEGASDGGSFPRRVRGLSKF
jgi:hypothetical protein